MLVLDFGMSFSPDSRPVIDKILERIPITIFINVVSLLLILSIAIPIGAQICRQTRISFRLCNHSFCFCGICHAEFLAGAFAHDLIGVKFGMAADFGKRVVELYGAV